MRLYHSAFAIKEEYIPLLLDHKIRILRSFATTKNIDVPIYCNGIFLDSGAFSAHNSGKTLDLYSYINFIKVNKTRYDVYAGLDVIGDSQASWKNQQIMDFEGLKALPTFHYGEDIKWLKRYINKYDHIALGGMVGKRNLPPWLNECWSILKTKQNIKVHGFGMTDFNLINRYPWYSVDSTTASRAGRVGVLLTPWGQLLVSEKLKSKSSAMVRTPKKIKVVLKWINEFLPELNINWVDISAGSVKASNIRTVINILYLEHLTGNYK